MSEYQPQVGDLVRVVLEDTVTNIWPSGFSLAVHDIDTTTPEVRSVEKVTPPLPTTPGSVIRDEAGSVRMLGNSGRWYHAEGFSTGLTSESAASIGYEVIFDAGQVTP